MIVAFYGRKSSGKTTLSMELENILGKNIILINFADPLKKICNEMFGISYGLLYGTDNDKNTFTHIMWENMPHQTNKTGPMTVRELLQQLGTEVFRKINNNVWIDMLKNQLKNRDCHYIVGDCRFDDEVKAIQDSGGIVIGLTRKLNNNDNHSSEPTNFQICDYIIDNANLTLDETKEKLRAIINAYNLHAK